MKILTIGSDRLLFKPASAVRRRVKMQATAAGEMHVIVFSLRDQNFSEIHDGSLHVYPTASKSRWHIPFDTRHIAKKIGRVDILSAQDPFWAGHIAWHLSRSMGAKLQLQIHTDIFSSAFAAQSLGGRLKVEWAKFHLHRASCIRVVSNRIKESLITRDITAPISVLPIFIDVDAVISTPVSDLKKEYPQFDKVILVAARLEKEKNVADAIRVMPEILKRFPQAGLVIAGDGSQKNELEQLARELDIEKNVIFLGRRDDIYSLYKSVDCCIAATAEYEGYGASTVEALAAGCPVVSRDIGIAREAGAIIAEKDTIAQQVIDVLKSGKRGELKLSLPTAEEWAKQWYEGISECGMK